MKVLIWFACLLPVSLPACALIGISFGGIPTVILYSMAFWLARTLCKMYDKHKAEKKWNKIESKTAELGTTPSEYVKNNIPQAYLKTCEFYRGKPFELEPYLKSLVKKKNITKNEYTILWEEYKK